MKTMKIIDLLNKIANGEEVPKSIYWRDEEFEYINGEFKDGSRCRIMSKFTTETLNEEVEIIEEDKEDNFTGWKMYQDGKEVCSIDCLPEKDTPKEDKKIEKIDISNFPKRNNSLKKTALKVNEIIDKINGE